MDDSAATAPSPAAATPTSASAAAGCDAARDKTINAGVNENSSNNSSSSSVKLIIKSSNQQYDDMNIEIESELCWTVQRLKKQLSLVYPGKPEINEQKLIYSGKLLDDAKKLSEVIRSYKDVYQQHHIFHLVCANKQYTMPTVKTATTRKDAATTTRTEVNGANVRNTNANELRQRQIPYQPLQQQTQQQTGNAPPHSWLQWGERELMQQAANGQPVMTTQTQMAFQQQMLMYNAWMQQVYAQYMQQCMQRTNSATPAAEHIRQPMHPLLARLPQPQPNGAAAAAQANGPGVVAQRPAARPVDRPNFPNIQEEPEMRDWLDSFFSFTRLAIFITVLYFNSSPLRCLLVVVIAGIIYLYHIGVLRRRRERNNNNINRNNNAADDAAAFAAVQQIQRMMDAVEQEQHDNNANNPNEAAEPVAQVQDEAAVAGAASDNAEQAAAAAALAAEAVAVEPPNANNSVISVVRTFVITFFTSLLPEAPAL